MAIIGIDLGTTNSLVCVWKDGKPVVIPNQLGERLTPSVISVDADGKFWVGAVAKEMRLTRPANSIGSFKRFMGTDWVYCLGGRGYKAQELSTMVLRQLKSDAEEFLQEPVHEAIISVPAYFNDEQRYATREAGLLAGLKVERLVNEPSAAALEYRSQEYKNDEVFLVVDFGGGTLDVSVVECFDQVIEITAVAGDNHLGGDDFDRKIAEEFCRQQQLSFTAFSQEQQVMLLKKAESLKRQMTDKSAGMMEWEGPEGKLGMIMTGEQLIMASASLLKRMELVIKKAIRDSGIAIHDIDQIILVGGTSRMPIIRWYVGHVLGKEPVLAENPDEIVALGAGVYAGIKERREDIKDVILTDICPFSLGVGIVDPNNDKDHLMSPLIERNTILPVSKMGAYYPVTTEQRVIQLNIYQGESIHCSENLELGRLTVPIPDYRAGNEENRTINVRFTYDINGILMVETEGADGRKMKKLIVNNHLRMDEEEFNRRLKQLEEMKRSSKDEEENQLIISRAERLYQECLGRDREVIGENLRWYTSVVRNESQAGIRAARKRVEQVLDFYEEKLDLET